MSWVLRGATDDVSVSRRDTLRIFLRLESSLLRNFFFLILAGYVDIVLFFFITVFWCEVFFKCEDIIPINGSVKILYYAVYIMI